MPVSDTHISVSSMSRVHMSGDLAVHCWNDLTSCYAASTLLNFLYSILVYADLKF
jgi:hypothetical protein